jgi:hypothetical protein
MKCEEIRVITKVASVSLKVLAWSCLKSLKKLINRAALEPDILRMNF